MWSRAFDVRVCSYNLVRLRAVQGGESPVVEDTGQLAAVPEQLRLDVDEGFYSNALEGGDDTDGLEEIYANPGELIDEDLE
jgi:hypothetical protein